MKDKQHTSYDIIESAIHFIRENIKKQPSLELIANHVNISPLHLQHTFQKWAGVPLKQFIQYLNIEYTKDILQKTRTYISDVALEKELCGVEKLHEKFVSIEYMTPDEYKNDGKNLIINYSFADSPFGEIFIASTHKGVCSLQFQYNHEESLKELSAKFPNAKYKQIMDSFQQNALSLLTQSGTKIKEIKLHLKGTAFQLKVWNALLHIPVGGLATYSDIAAEIKNDKAYRAVGTAIGDNPVAYIIPCHRVICSGGDFGNYHWGIERKTAIIGWEAAKRTH